MLATAVLLAGCAAAGEECPDCAIGVDVTLAWDPNPPQDNVLGYRMYFGATEDPSTMRQVDDVEVIEPGFDPAAPTRIYDAYADLALLLGDNACFRVTAYNTAGESGFSNPACKVVDGNSMAFGL